MFLMVWCALSFPVGLLVGFWLGEGACDTRHVDERRFRAAEADFLATMAALRSEQEA